jgi:hypothetical protein
MHEYHTLKALRDRASAEQVEEAEIDAAIAEHEAWKAAGRPGLKSHEEFMAKASLGYAVNRTDPNMLRSDARQSAASWASGRVSPPKWIPRRRLM